MPNPRHPRSLRLSFCALLVGGLSLPWNAPTRAADAPSPAQAELQAKVTHAQEELDALPLDSPDRPAAAAEVMRLKKLLHKNDAPAATPSDPKPDAAPPEPKAGPKRDATPAVEIVKAKSADASPEDFTLAVTRELKKKLVEKYIQLGLANDKLLAAAEKAKNEASGTGKPKVPGPDDPVFKYRELGKEYKRLQREVTEEIAAKVIEEQKVTFDDEFLQKAKEERKKRVDQINERIKTEEESLYKEKTEAAKKTFLQRREALVKERGEILRANDVTGTAAAILAKTVFRADGRIFLRNDPDAMAKPGTAPSQK